VEARFVLSDDEQTLMHEALMTGDQPFPSPEDRGPDALEWHFREERHGFLPILLRAHWKRPTETTRMPLVTISSRGSQYNYRVRNRLHEASDVGGDSDIVPEPFGSLGNRLDANELGVAQALFDQWRRNFYHLAPLRIGTERAVPLRSSHRLTSSGDNLAAVVLYLQTHEPEIWPNIRSIMQTVVPEIGELGARPLGDRNKIVSFDPKFQSYTPNLKDLGTGVEQLLMAVVVGMTQAAPGIVVIEEPETSLHPHAQRELLSLIYNRWSQDRLFILSTHSPVLINHANDRTALWLIQRSNGVSTVEAVNRESTAALIALGVNLSDVLSADRILLVEGPSDQAVLEQWFPNYLHDPRTEIIQAGGGDYARHVETLNTWLAAVDRLGPQRRAFFLRDRDELPEAVVQRLQDSPHIYLLPNRELENYLLDAPAITEVIMTESSLTLQPSDMETAIRAAADDLKSAVVLKRVARQLKPVGWVDNRMRTRLALRPSLEELQTEVLRGYPEPSELRSHIAELWGMNKRHVEESWSNHWRALAPGAGILEVIWRKYANRSYNKLLDGPAIARQISSPPSELKSTLESFFRR
jgi:predicted ATPase